MFRKPRHATARAAIDNWENDMKNRREKKRGTHAQDQGERPE
jgi:hypothetical protein